MKKFILFCSAIALCCLLTDNTQAQTDKKGVFQKGDFTGRVNINTWGEGGTYNFNGQESDKPKSGATNVSVGAETFINGNTSVGGFLGYDQWKSSSSGISNFEQSSSRFRVGPMASCFHPCSDIDNFGIRHTGSVYAGFGKDETKDEANTQTDDVFDLGLKYKTGVYWNPTPNLIIGADFLEAGYQTTKKTSQASSSNTERCNDWDLKLSPFNPSLSFTYRIGNSF